jgi:hypothetical protein
MTWQKDEDFKTAYNNFTCDYNPAQINVAYYFWKKSREGLAVELPDWDEYDTTKGLLDAVKEALEDIGVKWE